MEGGKREWMAKTRAIERKEAYLNSGFEREIRIARVGHFKDATESVLGQIANFEDLQVRGHIAQVELVDEDVIDNDGRLGRFIQSFRQEVARSRIEFSVGRQRRPVEVEGHVKWLLKSRDH